MELSKLENQLVELNNIKINAAKEKRYEEATLARDKAANLIARFKGTFIDLDENELIEAEKFVTKWTS